MRPKELQPACLCHLPEAKGYLCPVHHPDKLAARGAGSAPLAECEPAPRFAPSLSTFLSNEELQSLTGRRRASAQIRWLQERHWAFAVRADGRPVVAAAEFQAQMCTTSREREPDHVGPNLAALDRLG